MFITKKALHRRTFLQGMGVTLALPFLDAMVPALSGQGAAAPVRRFGAIYMPHGKVMSQWTPATLGADFDFPPILKPLEPFRDHLTVVSGLTSGPTAPNGGHAVAPASFLTGNIPPRQTEGADILAAITIDQRLAKAIGQETRFPSIEVATEDFSTSVGACDTGYSCTYMNTISWSGPTTPQPMEVNPRALFERMFGSAGTADQRRAYREEDRSILDAILQSARGLQTSLGGSDRARVTDYLDSVREIERRIQQAERVSRTEVISVDTPVGVPADYDEHVGIHFDLLAAALQADITRVFTFMLARDVSNISFPQIGVPDPHHALSHDANRPGDIAKMAKFAKVNTHAVNLFSKFVAKLQNTRDGDGTLLDHSIVLYGSGMSDGNDHTMNPLPLVLLGGGNGQMKKRGQHVQYPEHYPLANLWLTLGQKMGVEMDQFGRSTGTMEL
jgi:hypothetical protein